MMARFVRGGSRPLTAAALIVSAFVLVSFASAAAPSAPAVNTGGASGVTSSSAILAGAVNPHGLAASYSFQYGTTSGYGGQTPLTPAGSGIRAVKVSQAVTGLQPNTLYHYRIVAVNPAGTTTGKDHTFTTKKVPLSLQIAGVPNPVVFGSSFNVQGTLSGTGAAGHQVVLQANPFPYTAGFKSVGNAEVTNATGGFSFPFPGLLENAQLRVVAPGVPQIMSPVVVENVAVRVSFHVRRVKRRGYARFYGAVAPAEVGAKVGFQWLRRGRSVNVGGTTVKAAAQSVSRFSRVMRVRHRGLYRALVKISDGAHVSNYSASVVVR
jgi:hypothetical protein